VQHRPDAPSGIVVEQRGRRVVRPIVVQRQSMHRRRLLLRLPLRRQYVRVDVLVSEG
jgi:hypothetical protein